MSYQQNISYSKTCNRLISFSRYKASSSPLFHKLGILKVFNLVAIFRFQFVHDWIHKRLPTAFENMFQLVSSKHHNLRRNDDKVSLPFRRLSKWGTNTLRYQGAIIHNSLVDLNLHNTTSKLVVKNKLKSTYLSSYVWKGSFCLHCQNLNLLYFLSKLVFK